MKQKQLNTAQALLDHIALKTETLDLFDAQIRVQQWTASQRIKYLEFIGNNKDDSSEVELLKPQACVVALSLVDDKSKPLFKATWVNNKPVFDDEQAIDSLVENRAQETADAFVKISEFNGIYFGDSSTDDDETEEQTVKN